MKVHLRKVVGEAKLNFKELTVVLTHISTPEP